MIIEKDPLIDVRGTIPGRFVSRTMEVTVVNNSAVEDPITGAVRRRGLLQDIPSNAASYHKPEVMIVPPPAVINSQDRLTLRGYVLLTSVQEVWFPACS